MKFDVTKIAKEWAFRSKTGMPKTTNYEDIETLQEVLVDLKYPGDFIFEYIGSLLIEKDRSDDARLADKDVVYKSQDGKTRTIKYSSALTYDTDHPARIAAEKMKNGDSAQDKEGESPEKLSGDDFKTAADKEVDKGKKSDVKSLTTDKIKSQNREKDHFSTDSALQYNKEQERIDRETGTSAFEKGAGTHASRAGEAATHKALRMLKDGQSYDEIKNYLLNVASKPGAYLDKTWVKASLAATKQIENTFGIDNIDEVVWDTKSGHKVIDVEDHGTSADMFVKLKDGTRVGISLKKDGKVFLRNGGYKETFNNLTSDLKERGVPQEDIDNLNRVAGPQTYKTDLVKQVGSAAAAMKGNDTVNTVINKLKTDDQYAKETELLSRRDKINDEFFNSVIQKIESGKSPTGDEIKILARLANIPEIKSSYPQLYQNMRNADKRLTQRFLKGVQESPKIESALKEEVLSGIHVGQILGIDTDMNMDKFITVYGTGDEGSQLTEKTLMSMFGGKASNLLAQYRQSTTPENKKALIDELKSKINIDYKDGAKDGIIKIKHEGPPEQEYSLFTINTRSRGIGAAPTLEMAQTTYMANALQYGLDVDKWPPRQKKDFLRKQAEENE